MAAFLTYACALFLTFALDHALDIYLFDHYETMRGPGGTYQMLLVAGIPIALGSGLLFVLGRRLLRLPGIAASMGPRSAGAFSGFAVALLMFSVAHLTEWMWGQDSVLAHVLDLMALILLSLGSGGLAASWSGTGRARGSTAAIPGG